MSFGGGPASGILHLIASLFWLTAGAVALVVVLGVLFLLVRFLWFGTRAAQLYLARNGESPRFTWPPRPLEVQEPAAPRRPKGPAGRAPDAAPAPSATVDDPGAASPAPSESAP